MERVHIDLLRALGPERIKSAETNIVITHKDGQVVLPFSLEMAMHVNEARDGKASKEVKSPKDTKKKPEKPKASPEKQGILADIFGVCKNEFGLDSEGVRFLAPYIHGDSLSDLSDEKLGVVKNTMRMFKPFKNGSKEELIKYHEKFLSGKKLSEMSGEETGALAALARLIELAFENLQDGAPEYLLSLEVSVCSSQDEIRKEADILQESFAQS